MFQLGVTDDQVPSVFYGFWGKCGRYGWICTSCDYYGMKYHHAFPEGEKVTLIIAPMSIVGTILAWPNMNSHEFVIIAVEGRYDMDVVWVIFRDWLTKKKGLDPDNEKESGFPYYEAIGNIIIFMDGVFKTNEADIENQTMIVSRQYNILVQMELVAPNLLSIFHPTIMPGEGDFETHVALWKNLDFRSRFNKNIKYWTYRRSFIGYTIDYFSKDKGFRWDTVPPLKNIFMYAQPAIEMTPKGYVDPQLREQIPKFGNMKFKMFRIPYCFQGDYPSGAFYNCFYELLEEVLGATFEYTPTNAHAFESGRVLVAPNRPQYPPAYDHNETFNQTDPVEQLFSDESTDHSVIDQARSHPDDLEAARYLRDQATKEADLKREKLISEIREKQEKYQQTGQFDPAEQEQQDGPALQTTELQGEVTPDSTPGKKPKISSKRAPSEDPGLDKNLRKQMKQREAEEAVQMEATVGSPQAGPSGHYQQTRQYVTAKLDHDFDQLVEKANQPDGVNDLERLQAKAELTEIQLTRLNNILTISAQVQANEKELELSRYRAQIEEIKKKMAKEAAKKRDKHKKKTKVVQTKQLTIETTEQGGQITTETIFEGQVQMEDDIHIHSRHSTPTYQHPMETGGDEHAEIYDEQHYYEPVQDSPNILEQSTQLIENSSLSHSTQYTRPEPTEDEEYDQNMDDLHLEDDLLRPSSVQVNEYDRDEGDTLFEGDPDERLKEDEGIQEDQQDHELSYTEDDTIPITRQERDYTADDTVPSTRRPDEEEDDNGSLPPGGNEEEL